MPTTACAKAQGWEQWREGAPSPGQDDEVPAKLGANACAGSAFTHLSVPWCLHLRQGDIEVRVSEPCCED